MSTQNQWFEQKSEKHHNFSPENYLFYSVKNCSKFNGHVFLMRVFMLCLKPKGCDILAA